MRRWLWVFILAAGCSDGGLSLPDAAPVADLARPADLAVAARGTCTNRFGTAMTTDYGRLDGHLFAVVPLSDRRCSGDDSHVHLQIQTNGAVYNIAVTAADTNTVDVLFLERDIAVPGTFSEGWHANPTPLDYTLIGLHSTDFGPLAPDDVQAKLDSELAGVDEISVFTTGFGPDGGHLVHRNNGTDGAIVLQPQSATPHVLMFHFANQSF